jgi:hypothetical protein
MSPAQGRIPHSFLPHPPRTTYARLRAYGRAWRFEWDEAKAASNIAKHGVGFDEAALAMRDPFSQDFDDGLRPANLVGILAVWAYPLHRIHRERPPHPHHQRSRCHAT